MKWIPISEQMPRSGQRILIYWTNRSGRDRTSLGYWVDHMDEECHWEDWEEFAVHDEETDRYFVPEDWYEWGWETEQMSSLSNVSHWMHLPEPPQDTAS